jgi:hypothetical protein
MVIIIIIIIIIFECVIFAKHKFVYCFRFTLNRLVTTQTRFKQFDKIVFLSTTSAFDMRQLHDALQSAPDGRLRLFVRCDGPCTLPPSLCLMILTHFFFFLFVQMANSRSTITTTTLCWLSVQGNRCRLRCDVRENDKSIDGRRWRRRDAMHCGHSRHLSRLDVGRGSSEHGSRACLSFDSLVASMFMRCFYCY